ncbi:MAG: hypothetical protein ACP5JU_03540, partial [Minisyncoccia bacterium]
MEECNDAYSIWYSIIKSTIEMGHLSFPKTMSDGRAIPSPAEVKPPIFRKHIGEPKGQIADWRASFKDSNTGFHVVEYNDHYETHIDKIDPLKDPIGHLVNDSPGTIILGTIGVIVIGGLLYYIFIR